MKKTFLALLVTGAVAAASCKKNEIYECKDQPTDTVMAEVTASSQSEALSMCRGNSPNAERIVAVKKQ